MQFIADTHTHTVASTHAYSTILENARYAAQAGLAFLCWTDHAPSMPDGPHDWHFTNISAVPDMLEGVRVLRGVEVDIIRPDGKLDMEEEQLAKLEWVNVSIHPPLLPVGSAEDYTEAYVAAARNPHIDVISHSGHPAYPYDAETVVRELRDYGKQLEINEHSFTARRKSLPNCKKLAECCKRLGCRIVVASDAHFAGQIGCFPMAEALLREIGFPEELVLNASKERFAAYLEERAARIERCRKDYSISI